MTSWRRLPHGRAELDDVVSERGRDFPDRAHIDERRRTQAEAPQSGAGRELELNPAHIVGTAAQGVADDVPVVDDDIPSGVVLFADDPRPNAADVEAAHLLTEESVGDPDRVAARRGSVLKRMDVAALGPAPRRSSRRQTSLATNTCAADPAANVLHVAAEACEVLREDDRLATRRPDAVRVVVDDRISDHRGQARPEFVAQVLTGQVRIALGGRGPLIGGRGPGPSGSIRSGSVKNVLSSSVILSRISE